MRLKHIHYNIVLKTSYRLAFEEFIKLNHPDIQTDISDLFDESTRIYGRRKYCCITIHRYKQGNLIKNSATYDFLPSVLEFFIRESSFAPLIYFDVPFCKFMRDALDT